QHAWRAEAALQSVLLKESFLDRIELAVLLQSFHRHDLTAVRLNGERRARLDRLSVEQDRACAARRGLAPDVRARHFEVLADEMDEKKARLDFRLFYCSVNRDGDFHVSVLPSNPAPHPAFGHLLP